MNSLLKRMRTAEAFVTSKVNSSSKKMKNESNNFGNKAERGFGLLARAAKPSET